MAGADVRAARVDELAIDLVAEQIEVVLLHEVAYLVHFAACIEVARGVVRVADEDGSRLFVDEFLELLDLGQREAFVDGGRDGADDGACRDGERHVVGVGGLRHDDFVAGVQAGQEREEHGLAAAAGDDDVVGREVDVVLLVVADQLFAIAQIALAGAVLQDAAVDVPDGVDGRLGRRQVWLTDVQVVDVYSAVLGGVGQGSQLADGRLGHLNASYGNLWHLFIYNFTIYNLLFHFSLTETEGCFVYYSACKGTTNNS